MSQKTSAAFSLLEVIALKYVLLYLEKANLHFNILQNDVYVILRERHISILSYGRSFGDPPRPSLETSRTFFDTAEATEALFIFQA